MRKEEKEKKKKSKTKNVFHAKDPPKTVKAAPNPSHDAYKRDADGKLAREVHWWNGEKKRQDKDERGPHKAPRETDWQDGRVERPLTFWDL